MRFFTMAWWCGVQEGLTADPSADYWAHLDTLRGRVPSEQMPVWDALLSLALRDCRLRQLRLEPTAGTLHILIESYRGDKHFTLAYSEVEEFFSESDPEGRLSGPGGYGDIGYDEVDLTPTGAFTHRMLFSTGIELAVTFRGFELLVHPAS